MQGSQRFQFCRLLHFLRMTFPSPKLHNCHRNPSRTCSLHTIIFYTGFLDHCWWTNSDVSEKGTSVKIPGVFRSWNYETIWARKKSAWASCVTFPVAFFVFSFNPPVLLLRFIRHHQAKSTWTPIRHPTCVLFFSKLSLQSWQHAVVQDVSGCFSITVSLHWNLKAHTCPSELHEHMVCQGQHERTRVLHWPQTSRPLNTFRMIWNTKRTPGLFTWHHGTLLMNTNPHKHTTQMHMMVRCPQNCLSTILFHPTNAYQTN